MAAETPASFNAFVVTSAAPEAVTLTVSGSWSIRHGVPSLVEVSRALKPPATARRVILEAAELRRWDSALLSFLFAVIMLCRERGVTAELGSLPGNIRGLMELAGATPRHQDSAPHRRLSFLGRIGTATLHGEGLLLRAVAFFGECIMTFGRLLRGRARYLRRDLVLAIEEAGVRALPIVSIVALLVGTIFAFVGAIQLRQFGADIYDANLVAVGMTREMGAVMTAVVLTGRAGAAFAAQLGSMQENEEIDALSTLGLSPIDFLVLPRMIALTIMTPLLCVYADAVGILGGFLVGVNVLDVSPIAYLLQTQQAMKLSDFAIGVAKAAVFGWLVAFAGCFFGIYSGKSAAAVGAATTSAVVWGILAIIAADAVFAVLLNIIGI